MKLLTSRGGVVGVVIAIFGVILIFNGCSGVGGNEIVAPRLGTENPAIENTIEEPDHWVWGNWLMYVPEDHSSIEVVPVRVADMHFNVKILLEKGPCYNCIWTSNFVNHGDGTISIDVSIRHPYPESKYYTGFDVRGIFYTTCSYPIKEPGDHALVGHVPAVEKGDPELLNPDGHTEMAYRPDLFPNYPPIFRYQPGGNLGGTLDEEDLAQLGTVERWPFINYYSSEVRRHFATGAVVTHTYHIALPPGPWEFGYSVDACWAPPVNVPVQDIGTDFPPQANTLEAYKIEAFVSGPLIGDEPVQVTVRVYNHLQEMLQFYYRCHLSTHCVTGFCKICYDPVIVDDAYVEFTFEVANDLHRAPGRYPVEASPKLSYEGECYLSELEKKWYRNGDIREIIWLTVES